MYETGVGVEKDREKAESLYDSAAEKGDSQAISHGRWPRLLRDDKERIQQLRSAAEQGDDRAKLKFAELCQYYWSKINKDQKEATIRLLRSIANQKDPDVNRALGLYYEREQDYLLAAKFYLEATDNSKAKYQLTWDGEFENHLREEEVRLAILNQNFPHIRENTNLFDEISNTLQAIKNFQIESGFRSPSEDDDSGEVEYSFEGDSDGARKIRRNSKLFKKCLPIIMTFIEFIPRDYLAIIASYMTMDTPQRAYTKGYWAILESYNATKDEKLTSLGKGIRSNPSPAFFSQPIGDEKTFSSDKSLELRVLNLDIIMDTIQSTLEEITNSSSNRPLEIKGIGTLKSKKTAAEVKEWLLNHLDSTQYKQLRDRLLDKVESIPADLGENTFLEKQQAYKEAFKFLDNLHSSFESQIKSTVLG